MKKRFLSATLAAILAASSLSLAAFADDDPLATGDLTDVPTSGDTAGVATVSLTGTAKLPAIKVKLPASIGFVLNPYKLTVTTGTNTTDNNLVLSKPIEVENLGESKIAVNVTAVPGAEVTGSEVIISNTGAIDTKTAELKSAKQVAIWVEPATQKHTAAVIDADGTTIKDGTGTTAYTFANKYNAKTCALATTYTAPETQVSSIKIDTEFTSLGDAYTGGGKTITSAEWAKAIAGSDGTTKFKAIVNLLLSKGCTVQVGSSSNKVSIKSAADLTTYITNKGEDFVAAETSIYADVYKKAAIGVKPATITLFTLAPGDASLIAKESKPKAFTGTDEEWATKAPALDTNKGQFKISGTLNQDIEGNWTEADKVNVTLTFNIKLLSN